MNSNDENISYIDSFKIYYVMINVNTILFYIKQSFLIR